MVVVDQAVAHAGHGSPLHIRIAGTELDRKLFRRLADDLKTSDERTAKRLIHKEFVETEIYTPLKQVICFEQDVAQVITRLEGHPLLRPRCEDR